MMKRLLAAALCAVLAVGMLAGCGSKEGGDTGSKKTAKVIDQMNPTVVMKAVKNDVELKNIINAHVKDGVAVTRFMYWLKKNVGKNK